MRTFCVFFITSMIFFASCVPSNSDYSNDYDVNNEEHMEVAKSHPETITDEESTINFNVIENVILPSLDESRSMDIYYASIDELNYKNGLVIQNNSHLYSDPDEQSSILTTINAYNSIEIVRVLPHEFQNSNIFRFIEIKYQDYVGFMLASNLAFMIDKNFGIIMDSIGGVKTNGDHQFVTIADHHTLLIKDEDNFNILENHFFFEEYGYSATGISNLKWEDLNGDSLKDLAIYKINFGGYFSSDGFHIESIDYYNFENNELSNPPNKILTTVVNAYGLALNQAEEREESQFLDLDGDLFYEVYFETHTVQENDIIVENTPAEIRKTMRKWNGESYNLFVRTPATYRFQNTEDVQIFDLQFESKVSLTSDFDFTQSFTGIDISIYEGNIFILAKLMDQEIWIDSRSLVIID